MRRKKYPPGLLHGERDIIAAIRARTGRAGGALRLGIGDDCAILRPPAGHEIVVTTDLSLEGVHFRKDWHTPESVGHRCLARGLSDLAAMGAKPLGAFLSIALPRELTLQSKGGSWLERFLDGLLALADEAGVPLAGGDTAQSPMMGGEFQAPGSKQTGLAVADIVLVGAVKRGRALLRSSARAGDLIYVTGALGGSAAELLAVSSGKIGRQIPTSQTRDVGHPDLLRDQHPHFYPTPRLKAGYRLAGLREVHAAIDLSDGLSTDLAHICEESGLSAEVDAAALPVHALALRAERDGWVSSALELALHGGEDYELLFTAAPSARVPKRIGGVAVRSIGMIVKKNRGARVVLRGLDGSVRALEAGGWEHFSER